MKIITLILLLGLFSLLPAQETQGGPSNLEKELAAAEGKKKIEILFQLTGLYKENDPQKAIRFGTRALELVRTFKDEKKETRLLNHMCLLYENVGDFKKAKQLAERSKTLSEKTGDQEALADACNCLGVVHIKLGDYNKALEFHSAALKTREELGNKTGISESLQHIGEIYKKWGNYDTALEKFLQALKIEEELGNKQGTADALNNVGRIYSRLKKDPMAFVHFEKALKLQEELGNKRGMADCLNNIGITFQRTGNHKKARAYYLESLEIEEGLGNKEGMGIGLNNIGETYELSGDNHAALDYYLKSVKIAAEIGDRYGVAFTGYNIAGIYRKMGQYPKALEHALKALEIAKKLKSEELITKNYSGLSQIYADMGDYKNAYLNHLEFKRREDEMFSHDIGTQIAKMQTAYETEKKEKEIELLRKRDQIQALELSRQKSLLRLYSVIGLLIFVIAVLTFIRFRHKKKAEEALRESEEKYRELVERANDGITVLQDGVFKYVNPEFMRLSGYSREELTRNSIFDVIVPDQKEKLKKNYERRMAGEEVEHRYETVLLRKNGKHVDVEINAGIIPYENRPADLVVIRDISEKKQFEEEKLKRGKLEAVGILAGGIAHDFNDLLSVILGNIEMARLVSLPEKKLLNILSKAEKAAFKTRELAKRFLTFSEGGTPLKKAAPIQPIIQEALDMTLFDSNVQCRLDIPTGLWDACCDAEQIHQVFSSLISNAAEAVQWNGIIAIEAENVEIKPTAQNETENRGGTNNTPLPPGKYIRVDVKDKGEGIQPDHLPKIFDPYFSTRSRVSQKGLGFGLSIAYSIVRRHKGHIEVTSEAGVGTTATFYLPAADEQR